MSACQCKACTCRPGAARNPSACFSILMSWLLTTTPLSAATQGLSPRATLAMPQQSQAAPLLCPMYPEATSAFALYKAPTQAESSLVA